MLSTLLANRIIIVIEKFGAFVLGRVGSIDVDAVPVLLFTPGQGRVEALDDLVRCRVGRIVVAACEEVMDLYADTSSTLCFVGRGGFVSVCEDGQELGSFSLW